MHSSCKKLIHCEISHVAARKLFFDDPLKFVSITTAVSRHSLMDDIMSAATNSSEVCVCAGQRGGFSIKQVAVGDLPGTLLLMQKPGHVSKSYMAIAVIAGWKHKRHSGRYFVLDKCPDKSSPTGTVLCELGRDDRMINYGPGPESDDSKSFVDFVQRIMYLKRIRDSKLSGKQK